MDKKVYVSPRYELLKFDSRIATSVTSPCYEAVVSVVYDAARVTECKNSENTETKWNEEI